MNMWSLYIWILPTCWALYHVCNITLLHFTYKLLQGKAEEGEATTPAPAETGAKPANQFNFSERASQTYNNPLRVGI